MKVKQIIQAAENLIPLKLAQDWDNVGLLLGDENTDVKNILLTIDITKQVLDEAKRLDCRLIMSYHPIIWDSLKKITASGPASIVYELIRSGISVYSMHTAFDTVTGGLNDLLAGVIGIKDPQPLGDWVDKPSGPAYKIITFVPPEHLDRVAQAIFDAGAGAIGNYSRCSFRTEGSGTFLPLDGAKPAIGRKGRLETVGEIKLESVVPADRIAAVISAMRKAHPYEEPAFDVLRHCDLEKKFGLGRFGTLDKPAKLPAVVRKIKKATAARSFGIVGPADRTFRKAAVCAGSCGKLINTVISEGCDLYLTGELKHHQALAAQEARLTCICLTHTVSERFALKHIADNLKKQIKNVSIKISKKDSDPFVWKNI